MADDEEEDYMTMSFGEEPVKKPKETSLQRRARIQREGRERGRVPSKAELARNAEREREAALDRSLLEPAKTSVAGPGSKGLSMMARMGFKPGQALGKSEGEGGGGSGAIEPIRIQVKRGRGGIGVQEEGGEGDAKRAKRSDKETAAAAEEIDPLAYRDRLRQEREVQRLERQVHAVQVVAEGMEGDGEGEGDKPLGEINVLWRGLVRDRRKAEQERAEKQIHRRLLDASLRGGPDSDEDNDDRMAMGKTPTASYLSTGLRQTVAGEADEEEEEKEEEEVQEEEEEEDKDLAALEALPPQEQLQKIVDWLRVNRRYCFWCKCAYPDAELEGCPGATEADHD